MYYGAGCNCWVKFVHQMRNTVVFYEYTGEKGDPGFEGPGVAKGHQGAPGETGFRGPLGICNNDAPLTYRGIVALVIFSMKIQ